MTFILWFAIFLSVYFLFTFAAPKCRKPIWSHYPLIGCLPELFSLKENIAQILIQCCNKSHWQNFDFSFPTRHTLVVTDPKDIKYLLVDNPSSFPKNTTNFGFDQNLSDVFGQGLMTLEGESWRVQRKEVARYFHVEQIKQNMQPHFLRKGQQIYEILKKQASTSSTFDLQDLINRLESKNF